MAKGIVGNAADAAKAVAKTALGAAATAAATVVIENVARSIATKRSGKPIPSPTSQNPMPVVEEAVRQLLTAPPADRKRSKRAASRKDRLTEKRGAAAKKARAVRTRKSKAVRKTPEKPRKKR
jgi:hypothetical protein